MAALEPSPILSLADDPYLSEGDEAFFAGRKFFFVDPRRESQ